ncbi:hypothetical protein DDB_G0287631 [Dictyostelium discoideum AX4]|uniref:Uncharacterized protein n=1 Tax=Dictyostelium discoideum TaxID=44689 RepID=Q54K22_DICDI|nr:hypothetical protein DDB_G0287631 [Dictyostelium discoideum AX4]EAL63624.1 hypothetical protein DDB_G0287631 [Dictyostelium discoideum AX4]|eukprot:XP_637142.1 hypothetical protein DDB_G0287631 [Dictyostelium discoideum AX4]
MSKRQTKNSPPLVGNSSPTSQSSQSPEISKKKLKKIEQKANRPKILVERPLSNLKFGGLVVFFICLVIFYIYLRINPLYDSGNNSNNLNNNNDNNNTNINIIDDIKSMKKIENGLKDIAKYKEWNEECKNKTIAVGYNTNLDLVVDAIELMDKLKLKSSIHNRPMSKEVIKSLDDFEQTFSHYFKSGSAAERMIENEDTFSAILAAALQSESKQFYTGGNAGIMANRLVADGCRVYLGGIIGKKLKELLSPSVSIIGYQSENGEEFDEIHLIMEYNKQSRWGSISPPRSNRFIISRDNTNSHLMTMESFHQEIEKKQPDLLLLSGLHLLTEEAQERRVNDMVNLLKQIPYNNNPSNFLNHPSLNVPIHLELASIASPSYINLLAKKIIPFVDSVGLNEQELGFIYVSTGGKKFSLDDFKEPSVNVVVNALLHIMEISFHYATTTTTSTTADRNVDDNILGDFGIPTMSKQRLLTRIHFHYLSFHLIITKSYSQWSPKLTSASVAASSIEATFQACRFNSVELLLPLSVEVDYRYTPGATKSIIIDPSSPVTTWQDSGYEFHLAPVLVCKSPLKTVGLGDSISTMGFLYQTIKSNEN